MTKTILMELKTVPVEKIHANPFQPRESFDRESLTELAESIIDANVIQPVVVRKHGKDYQIIAGERRWRAAQLAGLVTIPCIVKDVAEERVLLESLMENLHRKDLTDTERENAIHVLWKSGKFKTHAQLAKVLGVTETRVNSDIEAKEFREKMSIDRQVSTEAIRASRGLPLKERSQVIDKVSRGDFGVREVYTVTKVLKNAHDSLKKELLKPKSKITPKMAETIIEKLPEEDEQNLILEETRHFRFTEDEVEHRVREIQHAKEAGLPLRKEMGVQEGTTYSVGEYECPHCRKRYLIKCDGKRDWVE